MNPADLSTFASLLGVPVSAIVIAYAFWLTIGKWARDVAIPRWLTALEVQAKAMVDISKIVESLQHEVRESRRVSIENNERLAAMDVKFDQAIGRPATGRARKVGEL
jgi:hypothetical protein